jgi:acyl-CoA thioesterase-1
MTRCGLARALALSMMMAAGSTACGSRDDGRDAPARPATTAPAQVELARSSVRPRVVILGDSLTAGLGLSPAEAYPTLLQQRVDAAGLPYEVVNAGVSGDTSAGGLSRLDWALEGDVRVLIIALGGNDGLRGLPVEELSRNLSAIIERAQSRNIQVALVGMEAPPNFGQAYIVSFHRVYPELAQKYGIPFVPFLLQGVAGVQAMNQRDGIHPTAEGAKRIADTVWPVLAPLLKPS